MTRHCDSLDSTVELGEHRFGANDLHDSSLRFTGFNQTMAMSMTVSTSLHDSSLRFTGFNELPVIQFGGCQRPA